MCKTRNSARVKVKGRAPRIDGCMRPLVNALNREGIETLACCCGHGRYRPTVVVRNAHGKVVEFFTGREIPRTRRYYFSDTDGYFYIPEVDVPKDVDPQPFIPRARRLTHVR